MKVWLELAYDELSNLFSEIIKNKRIVLYTEQDFEDDLIEDIFQYRNETTGEVRDVYIMSVSEEGISVKFADDTAIVYVIIGIG